MNISDIERKLQQIFLENIDQNTASQNADSHARSLPSEHAIKFDAPNFIYNLLLAYNLPKSSVARLKNGDSNLSKRPDELIWSKKLHFKSVANQVSTHENSHLNSSPAQDLHVVISQLAEQVKLNKHAPRFIIVTDYQQLLAIDTKTADSLDIILTDLPKHLDFFLPWAGMEKAQMATENIADVKAAVNMAKLYDLISQQNPANTAEKAHALNVFLSRLLFCFFAEDTHIFASSQFTYAITSHTSKDGSDLNTYLDRLFEVLNTPKDQRSQTLPAYLKDFEYVNGGLFKQAYPAPKFNQHSRELIITLGSLDWAAINPDIFGSMIQAVVLPGQRGSLGMHYTSVPNILKVIEPLFLDALNLAYEDAQFEPKKLNVLLERLSNIKIFDPACGSGNFLIIAYKKLCQFEIKILQQLLNLQAIAKQTNANDFAAPQAELIPKAQLTLAQNYQTAMFSRIALAQFYGIEIDDFAHEIATLSLWLAQHQMNMHFKSLFGSANPTLPLQPSGNIVHGNACRVDWAAVCPKNDGDEIYILGNPPYLGARYQEQAHRDDMRHVLAKLPAYKRLDYITIWFYKGIQYIANIKGQLAFVTTNSVSQGEQAIEFWPGIFKMNVEISFAHTSFKWTNNARGNAGVIVAIIGLRAKTNKPKHLILDGQKLITTNINAYLTSASNVFVVKKSSSISNFPSIERTNPALDDGHFLLNSAEKDAILNLYPQAVKIIKPIIGAAEFLRSIRKYCLWIADEDLALAKSIPPILERIEKVKLYRAARTQNETKNPVDFPHRFLKMKMAKDNALFIPTVSSERREYIPTGFIDNQTVIIDPNFAIYDPQTYIFAIISSKMHMAWVKTVCGRLKTDYRYSSSLCYNTFPFPVISDQQKAELEQSAYRILEAREQHTEKTLAQLYDPEKMPANLRAAHAQNDLAVERCYRSQLFSSDEVRLEYLFKLYEQMIADENAQLNLFAAEKKPAKTKLKPKSLSKSK